MEDKIFIPENFQISIFLDTNILVYLVDKSFTYLEYAIDFLANCPFVKLYTSEYALIEFINKRKQEHYLRKLVYDYKINIFTAFNYHKEFNADEVKFEHIKAGIKQAVEEDLTTLQNRNIDPEKHKFNKNIFAISKGIALNSKITIYDSLMIASALEPYCHIILTNDTNLEKFYNEENPELVSYFASLEKTKPTMFLTKDIKKINFTNNNNIVNTARIKTTLQKIILNVLKANVLYIGEVFTQKCAGKSSSITCFTLVAGKELQSEMNFVVINKNLSAIYSSEKISGFRTEDGQEIINFPFSKTEPTKISFCWQGKDDTSEIKQANNLIFVSPYT